MSGPLWLDEPDVSALVSVNDAIAALADYYRLAGAGEAAAIGKALGRWESGSAHAVGATAPTRGLACFKTWANTPTGASAIVELFSTKNGALLALIRAGMLGALRTSGICAVATDVLADPAADELALIGTGRQAMLQIAAIGTVRTLRRVRVHSPNAERRGAFVARCTLYFPFEVVDCASVDEAVADAPIVTTVTRAHEPFLRHEQLSESVHVNAAGAILPDHAELDSSVLLAASIVVVDETEAAARDSRELRESGAAGGIDAQSAVTLATLLADRPAARRSGPSVFKPMGSGLSDLAIASSVWTAALATHRGESLKAEPFTPPKWHILTGSKT